MSLCSMLIILYDLPGCAEKEPIYKRFTVQLQPETTTIYLVKFSFLDLAYLIHRQTF